MLLLIQMDFRYNRSSVLTLYMYILHTDAATEFSSCSDGDVRLIGGNQGRLEVCMNNAWGSVCDSEGVFTSDEAKVACRQLGILQGEGLLLCCFSDILSHTMYIAFSKMCGWFIMYVLALS